MGGSPLLHLWRGWVGPWLLRMTAASVLSITGAGSILLVLIFSGAVMLVAFAEHSARRAR